MTLQEVLLEQREAQAALAKLESDYRQRTAALQAKIAECERLRANVANGIDLDKITLAETLIRVYGSTRPSYGLHPFEGQGGLRSGVIEEAMTDIANGAPQLSREYFGVKNYDGFGDQRSDHPYGYGPRHGSIVFQIGLTEEARKRLAEGRELEPAEIYACLYYLEALKQGKLVREVPC